VTRDQRSSDRRSMATTLFGCALLTGGCGGTDSAGTAVTSSGDVPVSALARKIPGKGKDKNNAPAPAPAPEPAPAPAPEPAPAPAPGPAPAPAPPPPPPATYSATVAWSVPLLNTDGSSLTDISGYRIHYGTSVSDLRQSVMVSGTGATSGVISGLAPGTYFFAVSTVNLTGNESTLSNAASKAVP
jgi:hypothetical protein